MPELVGFQTMVIIDSYGMTFDAVGVLCPDFWLLFKSGSSYCEAPSYLLYVTYAGFIETTTVITELN